MSPRSDSREGRDGEAMAAPARGTPASQGPPYTTRPLEGYGKVSGVVELDGQPPPDTVFQPSVDQPVCGAAFTRRGIERRGNRASASSCGSMGCEPASRCRRIGGSRS